jgi:hypothetical protein
MSIVVVILACVCVIGAALLLPCFRAFLSNAAAVLTAGSGYAFAAGGTLQ